MSVFHHIRKVLIALSLVLVLFTSTACVSAAPESRSNYQSGAERSLDYGTLARGDTAQGQNFGDWVVETSRGLIKDAYVRDNDKLGVVISKQVRPDEVKSLTQALVQGFRRTAPNRDLTVLVYAPDKQRILTARYNTKSRQVEYNS